MSAIAVLITCPDAASGERIAATLVEERLAACVNLLPGVRSVYRWRGAVEHAEETLLLVKTAADRLDALTDRVRALHPYELPEIIAVDIAGGLGPYLRWIEQETAAPPSTPAADPPPPEKDSE